PPRRLREKKSRDSNGTMPPIAPAATAPRRAVSSPKCRYRPQDPCRPVNGNKWHHLPFPTNNLVMPAKILKSANENAARWFLCRIYLHRSRRPNEAKCGVPFASTGIVQLTVNPAAPCSKMNQSGPLLERARETSALEVLRKLRVMKKWAKRGKE